MSFLRKQAVLLVAVSTLALAVSLQFASAKKNKRDSAAIQMNEQKRALHVLNRLAFGPRSGDVERVTAMGVDKWIDQQLQPEKIDDRALDARLAPFRTLRMDTRELVENFPPPQVIKAIAEGKQSLPSDSTKRAVYKAQLQRYQEKQERKQEAATADPAATATSGKPAQMSNEEQARHREARLYADLKAEDLLDLPPDQRMKAILKMSPEDQRAIGTSLQSDKRDEFMEGMKPQQRETLMALNNPQQVVTSELVQSKLLRAIYSDRQLEEVMTDFWFNHFNVFIGKGADRFLVTGYERDVIRPHVLGKFEDLLVATAKSPAMLFYLDNWMSVGPNSLANGVPSRPMRPYRRRYPGRFPPPGRNPNARGKRNRGLNENYGRELMELHTLSVNGGYSQRDVTEVAKVFTGWTIDKPEEGGGFKFDLRMHEPGSKFVLGHKIKDKGEGEGRDVLHLLATSPQTAHFLSLQLAQRFVADDPPDALVDRMAKTFLKKKGDIREVLSTLFHSPEFWADGAYRAKVKTPLEFVASAVRATSADVQDALPLVRAMQQLGMPLYMCQSPTGYKDTADAWVNTGALVNRMNFSLTLASNKLPGIVVDSLASQGDGQTFARTVLGDDVSETTRSTVAKATSAPQMAALTLGAPE